MPKVSVDFSQVEEFEPLPKAEYDAIIEEMKYVEPASEDKYPYINVQFNVTEDGFEGRKLWLVWSFSPRALWRFKQALENLGLAVEELEVDYDEETMLVTEPDLVGMPCRLAVSQRTYEGKQQNQVDAVIEKPGAKAKTGAAKPKAAAGAKRKFQ